jgi:hypothetical protein
MGNHQEFRVEQRSRRDQLTTIGTSLCFIVVIALVLWSQPWLRTRAGYTAGGAIGLFMLWVVLREVQMMISRRNSPVVIDEHGIRYASPGEIAWSDIAGIEPVSAMQRVDLYDSQGQVRVSLRYDLEEAGELVQFVADMLGDRWPQKPLPHEFSPRISPPLLAVGATAVAALGGAAGSAYWMQSRPTIEAACLGALVLVVMGYTAVWASSIRRLTIGTDGISVAKGIKSQGLYFSDIAAVGLVLVERGRGERRLDVKVTLKDESSLYVLPRRCDPFDVYATLKGAWQRGCAAAAAAARIPASAA